MAFTILEMIVALILSFFLLGIVYLSYNIMTRYLDQKKESDLSRLLLVSSEFEMLFFRAHNITEKEKGLCFLCEDKEFEYILSDDAIIRNQTSQPDTIYAGKYSYQVAGYSDYGRIYQLTLWFENKKDTLQMTFEKKYWSNQLLKDKEINFEY